MVDAVANTNLQPFTTVQYEKDGEKFTATKNNGIVTTVSEKGEVRQMPLEQFMTEELPKIKPLVNSPEKDTVEIGNKTVTAQPQPATTEAKPQVGQNLNVAA